MMVDFSIQVSIHREPPEVGLVEVNQKFVLVGGAVCVNPT